ncbi:hypothetical protein C8A05DRAFT_37805 [Staphylotrichum tortipilum]|uniref:Uncharacterized protein n=1 Tax=Staphylotrichum tortipilum TaxID=2831512 RepID=A0AAN6MCY5_9PEZI|nr:hypothetical protein C8A05DRAFT_37805 [Staphylotrichum longicolle]
MASSTSADEQVLGPELEQSEQQAPQTKPSSEPSLDGCIESLIVQWQACIEELQQLQQASETSTTAGAGNRPVRGLNALLKVQQRALDKAAQKHQKQLPSSSPTAAGPAISQAQYFGIKSCCWEDRWAVVKKCRGLVAINKDFPRSPRLAVAPDAGWLAYKDQPFQERPVAVDAVVDSGATWIKFISISSRTLEYQVVAEGWASEDEDEDEEGHGAAAGNADDGLSHTEFADAVKKIILAARWNHCRRVHLILPGLREGKSELVDRMLRYVRHRIGEDITVEVSCADSPFLTGPAPPLDDAITALIQDRDGLVGDDCGRLTDTINLDPSALVALATDLHHGPVPLQPESQQRIITQSILDHETDNNNELVSRQDILRTVLYPALRGRKLVCTASAAAYLRKLIDAISTHSEESRAALIFPSTPPPAPSTLLSSFQQWSTIPVPPDLHLPVEIVPDLTLSDIPPLIASHHLPPMALGVATDLSPLNRSVYLHGWARRLTTVTGHRGIERQVRLSLARHWTRGGGSADQRPPDIWHRHLGGYLIHRDKPKEWRVMVPEGEVPPEVIRWTNPWTTWGRGISTYGLPDTKTWEGVGHEEKTSYGRRMDRREGRAARGEQHEEQQQS